MNRYLRTLRLHRGLTQHQLAKASRVSQNQISKLEMGQVVSPRYTTVVRLADALHVHPSEIRFGRRRGREAAA